MLLIAYLLGSIPVAILVCHSMGINDPRQHGSGNPGASNVLRIGNQRAAGLTLLGDMGKGSVALLPAAWLQLPTLEQGLCAMAVLLGHVYPLFARFRGGKGVATALGAVLVLYWPLAVIQLLFWCLIFLLGRIASLASVSTALISPLAIWILAPQLLGPVCLMGLLLLLTHRTNIEKLLAGRESRF